MITPDDLETAEPRIQPYDIVIINTGSHRLAGDNDDYFNYSPGLYDEAARWLVERQVKLVGVDVQALDHPLGTKLVEHGPGPSHPHLIEEYRREFGHGLRIRRPRSIATGRQQMCIACPSPHRGLHRHSRYRVSRSP